eukprot:1195907-Prorocentrum_minimum.AAC.1
MSQAPNPESFTPFYTDTTCLKVRHIWASGPPSTGMRPDKGFHWDSSKHNWYDIVEKKLDDIAAAGFTGIWLPPPSDSIAPQGYLPRDLYKLDTAYGTEAQLRQLISAIHDRGMHAMADIVINHRCVNRPHTDVRDLAGRGQAVEPLGRREDELGGVGGVLGLLCGAGQPPVGAGLPRRAQHRPQQPARTGRHLRVAQVAALRRRVRARATKRHPKAFFYFFYERFGLHFVAVTT